MRLAVEFSSLSDVERDDLAGRLLVQAEELGLAVRLPERTRPYTVAEAAMELNVSKGSVYNMVEAERLVVVAGLAVKMVTAGSLHAVRDGLG